MPQISVPQKIKQRLDRLKAHKQPYSGIIWELLERREVNKDE